MTYELAKKLKNAGFSQEGKGWKGRLPSFNPISLFVTTVYFPTLSELIEACGDGFFSLKLVPNSREGLNWRTRSTEYKQSHEFAGQTPEEAVANLWLELNKKRNDKK